MRALGVDRIDIYQLHAPDPDVPFEESVGRAGRPPPRGEDPWVGLSNVSVAQIRAAEAIVPVASVQNRLNPFFREALEEGVVAYCTERGIGFLAYSPTGGGRLNRKLPEHPVLRPMAARLGVSAHALVLAWVLAQVTRGHRDSECAARGARAGQRAGRGAGAVGRGPGGDRSGGVLPGLSSRLSSPTAPGSPPP